jgi:hypothetical protein
MNTVNDKGFLPVVRETARPIKSRRLRMGSNQPAEVRRRPAHCRALGIQFACLPSQCRTGEPERCAPRRSARRRRPARRRWLLRQLQPLKVLQCTSIRDSWGSLQWPDRVYGSQDGDPATTRHRRWHPSIGSRQQEWSERSTPRGRRAVDAIALPLTAKRITGARRPDSARIRPELREPPCGPDRFYFSWSRAYFDQPALSRENANRSFSFVVGCQPVRRNSRQRVRRWGVSRGDKHSIDGHR